MKCNARCLVLLLCCVVALFKRVLCVWEEGELKVRVCKLQGHMKQGDFMM